MYEKAEEMVFAYLCFVQVRKGRKRVSTYEIVERIKYFRINNLDPLFAAHKFMLLKNKGLVEPVKRTGFTLGWKLTDKGMALAKEKYGGRGPISIQGMLRNIGT